MNIHDQSTFRNREDCPHKTVPPPRQQALLDNPTYYEYKQLHVYFLEKLYSLKVQTK